MVHNYVHERIIATWLSMSVNVRELHSAGEWSVWFVCLCVLSQKSPEMFNKAVLMNAGFLEAAADADYDCYVFHDVDMIPEDVRNIYVCSLVPRHIGSHLAQWDYR